ncbi:MAG: hypothetical protein IKL62_03330 [Clostridia bacterium]|nr:hypothetical protein [Oscillospiraceae bacterium]MBR6693960.1 hypothetical protein [Clostridia bacterium]
MKRKAIILAFSIILSFSSVLAINSYAAERKSQIIHSSLPIVLKQHHNCIAAYRGDEIIEIFTDVVYDTLPEYDRNTLKKGIPFSNIDEVYSAIEDYDS